MQMDEGLDTGAMLHSHVADYDTDTSASLYHKLAQLGPQALIEALAPLADGSAVAEVRTTASPTTPISCPRKKRWQLEQIRCSAVARMPCLQPLACQPL